MELLQKFRDQYEEFCKIDDFNLESRSKRVPAEKHFWVCRLIDARIEHNRLSKRRRDLTRTLTQKLHQEAPVRINGQIEKDIENAPTIQSLNDSIQELEFLIQYLEMVVKNVTFIAQDIKNIIEIKRLEEN